MPGVLRRLDRSGSDRRRVQSVLVNLPLKSRDGSPLLQSNRPPLVTDQGALRWRPGCFRCCGDSQPGSRCRRSSCAQHRAASRCDRVPKPRSSRALRSSTITSLTTSPSISIPATQLQWTPPLQKRHISRASISRIRASPLSPWSRARRSRATTGKLNATPSRFQRRGWPGTGRRWQRP